MKTLLKIIAFVLVLIFIVTLPISLLVFDLGRVVFNPPLVKRVITDEVVKSDLIPVALDWFSDRQAEERAASGEADGGSEPDVVQLMAFMDYNDWREIKNEVLPDEILTEWVSVTVDGVYGWIDSEDRVPQITWQMNAFKNRANSQHGVNAIMVAYGNLNPCTQPEIDDFLSRQAAVPAGTEVAYNLCEFPEPWHDDQLSDYRNSLAEVVSNIPPEFALTGELSRIADTAGAGPETIKQQLRLIRLLMNIVWLVPLGLLLLILLLAVRSRQSLGRWWGVPLVVGGLIALLPALTYRGFITGMVAASPLSETPELVIAEATRAIQRLAAEVFQPLLYQSGALVAVGLLLVLFMVARKKQPAGTIQAPQED